MRGKRSLRDDRGMTAVEFVVLTPLLFLLLMLTVQFALYLFAKQAATAAVQDGARTAREEAASSGRTCQDASAPWQQDAVKAATDGGEEPRRPADPESGGDGHLHGGPEGGTPTAGSR